MKNAPQPIPPGPGQETVWHYPRTPRVEPTTKRIQVIHADRIIVDTRDAYRVIERGHPPAYYVPPEAILFPCLQQTLQEFSCPFKGRAWLCNLEGPSFMVRHAAWSFIEVLPAYQAIQFYVAFHAHLLDQCLVEGERVTPQPGGYYGGWITADIVGPFKGGVGTLDW